ncbi:MAG: hypothetical protein LBJ18_01860 [Rickettsiales bacterium]|jgi:hypothetical protein|nr:hypothetical protein [Rickettsiales bacterium]
MLAKFKIMPFFALFSAGFSGVAFADARLPVVNVAAAGVSARAAFGVPTAANTAPAIAPVSEKQAPAKAPVVVARAAANQNHQPVDILTPRRPSDDLWANNNSAKNSKPPRLAEPVVALSPRDWAPLAEESLDMVAVAPLERDLSLDDEIAKLIATQRRVADAAETQKPSWITNNRVIPRAEAEVAAPQMAAAEQKLATNEIAVRRVVVPAAPEPVEYVSAARAADKAGEKTVEKKSQFESDLKKLSPGELKKAFKKAYLSENKHLSTYQIDDRFDVASDFDSGTVGFDSSRDLSESGGVRPLEIKIGFRGDDSALSRDNYNLLSEYASIVVSNPKRAIQVSIPESATRSFDGRKLAARRLAIVEQVLRDTGVADSRIVPVLASRSDDSFVLRVISSEQFETMTQSRKDMFGDTTSKKTYKSMSW